MNSIFSSQNMYIFFYNHLKNLSNIVLAPRGEISKNALKIKKFKKQIVLSIFKIFKILKNIDIHATDKFEAEYIEKVLPDNNIHTIKNFVSTNIPKFKKSQKKLTTLICVLLHEFLKRKT